MYCEYCHKPSTDLHHVIFRSQNGTNNKENLIPLCRSYHFQVHNGTNTELRNAIQKVCYDYIRDNIDKCWEGIYPSKVVRQIKVGLK